MGAWCLHAKQKTGERCRDHAGFTRPAHKQHLVDAPLCAPVRQRAEKHGQRSGNQHENGHNDDTAQPVLANELEIDLSAEQQEYEQPHDERGRHDEVVEFLCLSLRHLEPERILVSDHDAEHENSHEAARLQAVGCAKYAPITTTSVTIGAYSARKAQRSCAIRQCGQITKHGADNDPDRPLA